ncbi:MAG: hypothetical protein WCJ49_08680, partial [Deltaproteobacteria bacterium]
WATCSTPREADGLPTLTLSEALLSEALVPNGEAPCSERRDLVTTLWVIMPSRICGNIRYRR